MSKILPSSSPSTTTSLIRHARCFFNILLFGAAIGGIALTSNIIQILSLVLYPWSRRTVARINAKACEVVWWTLAFAMEKQNKARITFSGDINKIPINHQPVLLPPYPHLPAIESALIISNHVGAMDWALINSLAIRKGMLAHGKYFIKASMQWVPFFGPGMRLAGFPFLSRNWTADNHKIERLFHTLSQEKLPCWLISFLEGTRITPQKLAESQEFSRSKNLPVLTHVMYPRKKGFMATLTALRDSHICYVYDFTLAYRHLPTGKVNEIYPDILAIHTDDLSEDYAFHVHIDRIAIIDIPDDPKSLGKWIESRWVAKDERLSAIKKSWPQSGSNGVVTVPYFN